MPFVVQSIEVEATTPPQQEGRLSREVPVATVVIVILGGAGIAFMIRFFVALCRDEKTSWSCYVVSIGREEDARAGHRDAQILPFERTAGGKEVILQRRIARVRLPIPGAGEDNWRATTAG
jgi:hypothetical protein